jgi:magnesium transporter
VGTQADPGLNTAWGSPLSLTITVGLSLFILIVWANSTGSLLPVLAACLRIDPAVISGPVMSTLVDASGLFVCFILAHLIITKSQQNKGDQKRI